MINQINSTTWAARINFQDTMVSVPSELNPVFSDLRVRLFSRGPTTEEVPLGSHGGLKIVFQKSWIAVFSIVNRGVVDEFDRPVLSAEGIILHDVNNFSNINIGNLMRLVSRSTTLDSLTQGVSSIHAENSVGILDYTLRKDPEFIASVIEGMWNRKTAFAVIYSNEEDCIQLVEFLTKLFEYKFFKERTFSLTNFGNREPTITPGDFTFMQSETSFNKVEGKQVVKIDLRFHRVVSRGKFKMTKQLLLLSKISQEEWFGFASDERQEIIRRTLIEKANQRKIKVRNLSPKVEQLARTLKRIEELEKW